MGLETSLAASYTALCLPGYLTLPELLKRMSAAPASILGLEAGAQVGHRADLMAFDPRAQWTVEPEKFRSKGRNTLFGGKRLTGRVTLTMVEGKIVFQG